MAICKINDWFIRQIMGLLESATFQIYGLIIWVKLCHQLFVCLFYTPILGTRSIDHENYQLIRDHLLVTSVSNLISIYSNKYSKLQEFAISHMTSLKHVLSSKPFHSNFSSVKAETKFSVGWNETRSLLWNRKSLARDDIQFLPCLSYCIWPYEHSSSSNSD